MNNYELDNKHQSNIMSFEGVFREEYQRELVFESVLADYNEDVNRIIRVDANPVVKNHFTTKSALNAGGAVAMTVLYVSDSSRQLRSYTFSGDFDFAFDMKSSYENTINRVNAEIKQINCRLLNARKLSVKIQLNIIVEVCKQMKIADDIQLPDDSTIEKLMGRQKCCSRLCSEEKDVKASEEMLIPADKPIIGEILNADVILCVTDVKALYDKALVKMNAMFKCLYQPQNTKGEYICFEHTIPMTHIVDVDNMDEDYKCMADATMTHLNTTIDQDAYGDNRIISADIGIKLCVEGYKNVERECIVDAFSPKCECSVQYQRKNSRILSDIISTQLRVEDSMVIEDNPPEKVLEICGTAAIDSMNLAGSLISLQGSADMSVIVQGADGYLENLDCTIEFKRDIDTGMPLKNSQANTKVCIEKAEAELISGKLTIKLELLLETLIFDTTAQQTIASMELHHDRPLAQQAGAQFLIYYPTKTETVWNIAKQYRISQQKIMQANSMEVPSLSDRKILIIPCK